MIVGLRLKDIKIRRMALAIYHICCVTGLLAAIWLLLPRSLVRSVHD
jgi:hypothetical protein